MLVAAELFAVLWIELAVPFADYGLALTIVFQRDVPIVIGRSARKLASLRFTGTPKGDILELARGLLISGTEQSTAIIIVGSVEEGRLDRLSDKESGDGAG